jgi:hypothetical protein
MKLLIPLIATMLLLNSCTTTAPAKAAAANVGLAAQVCGIWSPLSYSGKLDSQATKDQIKSQNAKRNAFCK